MKLYGFFLTLLAVHMASAQVVTGISFTGGASASANAYHLVQKTGYTSGSGRGGGGVHHPYTYYVKVVDQSLSASVPFILGQPAQTASVVCTRYQPTFSANATTLAAYTEAGTTGSLNLQLAESLDALPVTTGLNRVDSSIGTSSTRTFFSVPNDTTVTITLSGSLSTLATYSIATTSTDGDPVIAYVSPGVYTLTGGFGYYITLDPISTLGVLGTARTGSLNLSLDFSVVPGGGNN